MAELREIPVEFLMPPDQPMRTTSTAMSMEELIESIASRGLLQPIGVTDLANGWYQIRWGMRRTLAHRHLGKQTILAMVHAIGEGDAVDDMAAENFQREQLSEAEECRFFHQYVAAKGVSPAEAARRLRVPYGRVARAIHILGGDSEVVAAFEEGKVSAAQAAELVDFPAGVYRQNALHHTIRQSLSAKYLRAWREQVEVNGLDLMVQDIPQIISQAVNVNRADQQQCNLCNEWKWVAETSIECVCGTCLAEFRKFVAWMQQQQQQQQEGEGNGRTGDQSGAGETSAGPNTNGGAALPYGPEWDY